MSTLHRIFPLAAAMAASALIQLSAASLDDVINALAAAGSWRATADYTVSMPQMLDDVTYRIDLESSDAPADSLAPCDYLIDWQLVTDDDTPDPMRRSTGFSAYSDGNHFRYSSGRPMQEYHIDWDSIPFIPRLAGSRKAVAVQRSARFCELLPQMLAMQLRQMQADPAYSFVIHNDTTVAGRRGCVVVDMRRSIGQGSDYAQEGEYVLDGNSLMPVRITLENNPGSIAEQTVTASFTPLEPRGTRPDEQLLSGLYPDVFARWRESNYRIETLPGHRLPEFSLPDIDGSRMEHGAAAPLAAPTVFVVFDPDDSFTAPVIEAVRQAVDQLPVAAETVLAALSSNADHVAEVVGMRRPGEHHLISARGLARDCGVADTPAVVIVGRDGVVDDVFVGFNNSLRTDVIQSMSR